MTLTPEFQTRLQQANLDNATEVAQIAADDPERNFSGNVCANGGNECAGDVRFYDWKDQGFAIVKPVLFTARNGSTISGHVWATARRTRPAARGRDHQRLGPGTRAPLLGHRGDARQARLRRAHLRPPGPGAAPTPTARAPTCSTAFPRRPASRSIDDTEDALDFMLSTPGQALRAAAELLDGHRPLPEAGPPRRRGARRRLQPASRPRRPDPGRDRRPLARRRRRLLHRPARPARRRDRRLGQPLGAGRAAPSARAPTAPRAPRRGRPTSPITKPAIGISNDYGIDSHAQHSDPDPQAANAGFTAYKQAGVDSMEFHIRGGTHEESAFIPGNTTGYLGLASLRGNDMVAWYTTAWFDKYVKCAHGSNVRGRRRQAPAHRPLARRHPRRPGRHQRRPQRSTPSTATRATTCTTPTAPRSPATTCAPAAPRCARTDSRRATTMSPTPTPRREDGDGADSHGGGGGSGGRLRAAAARHRRQGHAGDAAPSGAGDAIRGRGGDDSLRGGDGDDCLYGNKAGDDGSRRRGSTTGSRAAPATTV